LIKNRQDKVASECGKNYINYATSELLMFAINNSNEEFIKQALRKKIFDSEILHEPKMIEFYLKVLK